MTYTTYDKTTVAEQEKIFTARFILALKKDISSSKHGTQTNSQVLYPAIHLLENRHLSPQLSLEQIVRGALNMALVIENSKYGNLKPESVGPERYKQYLDQEISWFDDYDEQLDKGNRNFDAMAIPVIERASKGPLLMMTGCVQGTLDLYFEYTKQFDPKFAVERGSRAAEKFSFDIFTPELGKPKEPELDKIKEQEKAKPKELEPGKYKAPEKAKHKDENQFLSDLLQNLSERIGNLKQNPNKHKNSIAVAEKLHTSLSEAVTTYQASKTDSSISTAKAKETFIQSCTTAIDKAKPILEKELGWGEYLVNLLKSIANAFISAANTVTQSNRGFFTPDKAPMVSEVEEIEKEVKNINSPPSS